MYGIQINLEVIHTFEMERMEILQKIVVSVCFTYKNCQLFGDFPGGSVVKTLCFQCRESRLNS